MFPCIILYSLLFDNPLHDHDTERHGVHTGGVLVDLHVVNSGEEVDHDSQGGGRVDRDAGGADVSAW